MSYGGFALEDQASNNPQTQLQGIYAGGQAVNIGGSQINVDELLAQLGEVNPSVNANQQYQQLQGQYAQANAGLGMEQLGLQGQALGAQAGLLNTQYGIQQQTLKGQEQLAATQYGLSQQDIQAQKANQALNYGNQQINTQGQIATSGAVGSQGQQRQVGTEAFQNTQANAALARQQQGEQAQYGFQQQQFGLEQEGQAAQQQYSLGDIARGEQGLGLAATANGLSLDQTLNQVNYGMQQAGLQGQQTFDQLYGQLGTAQGQGATYEAGAIGAAALTGGVNLNQALAGGGP
jgi:hypothetical protein